MNETFASVASVAPEARRGRRFPPWVFDDPMNLSGSSGIVIMVASLCALNAASRNTTAALDPPATLSENVWSSASEGDGVPRRRGQARGNRRRCASPWGTLVDGKSPRNTKGAVGWRETSAVMVVVESQLLRLAWTSVSNVPQKMSLSGCPNQSKRATT